jgi:hypothetical protein
MKSALRVILLVVAVALLGASVFFFFRTGERIVDKDYLGGLLEVVAGLALVRAGVELVRLTASHVEPHTS